MVRIPFGSACVRSLPIGSLAASNLCAFVFYLQGGEAVLRSHLGFVSLCKAGVIKAGFW